MSMCSFVAHLCVEPVCLQLRHGSKHSQPSFTPLAFQPSQKQPLKPTSVPFPSLSHLLFVLLSITSNTGTKAAEQKPWLKNRPITNINLKRCWSAWSTFMHKDNSGTLFSLLLPLLQQEHSLWAAMSFIFSCKGKGKEAGSAIIHQQRLQVQLG